MSKIDEFADANEERILAMVEADDCLGLCVECGEEAYGVEPDARRYECECCGKRGVYGAEELLMRIGF